MSKQLSNNIAELNESIQQYFQAKIGLVKLLMLKKSVKSLTFLFGFLIMILLFVLFIAFAGGAFVIWYGLTYNDYLTGMLIVSGFIFSMLLIFILLRKKILTSLFLANISNILFEEDEDQDEEN